MTPNWQRAKVVQSGLTPQNIGRELWVSIDRPTTRTSRGILDGTVIIAPAMDCNLIDQNGRALCLPPECVERLSRDELDFAETVEFIPWEEWSKP